jgi:uncharacterized protein YukE
MICNQQDECKDVLEIALQQLSETMRRLDQEWQRRATSSYQHHDIAANIVVLWKHQAEEMLRMLYGTEE